MAREIGVTIRVTGARAYIRAIKRIRFSLWVTRWELHAIAFRRRVWVETIPKVRAWIKRAWACLTG